MYKITKIAGIGNLIFIVDEVAIGTDEINS